MVRRVEAQGLVAAVLLARVVRRVPADLLVEDRHAREVRVKAQVVTANVAQVSPNTAIVRPIRALLARAARDPARVARELAHVAKVMPRVGLAIAVSANLTVNAVSASLTVSVRVVRRVRVLVARAAREPARAARFVVARFPKSVSSGR